MINKDCVFCDLDKTRIYNTILEETDNFIVIPTLGALVDVYVLIVAKKHLYNMNTLNKKQKKELFNLIKKYRSIFKNIYGKFPIIFEHGSIKEESYKSASSVVHAHIHIVNHNYVNEKDILNQLNFKQTDDYNNLNKNYIFYISPNNLKYITYNLKYITYNFEYISQIMRRLIAKDLGFADKYNWRNEIFIKNVISTINNIKNYK